MTYITYIKSSFEHDMLQQGWTVRRRRLGRAGDVVRAPFVVRFLGVADEQRLASALGPVCTVQPERLNLGTNPKKSPCSPPVQGADVTGGSDPSSRQRPEVTGPGTANWTRRRDPMCVAMFASLCPRPRSSVGLFKTCSQLICISKTRPFATSGPDTSSTDPMSQSQSPPKKKPAPAPLRPSSRCVSHCLCQWASY